MLLRPFAQRYKIIPPMYVHGIMDGEAMEWLEKGELQLDDIMTC